MKECSTERGIGVVSGVEEGMGVGEEGFNVGE